MIKVFNMTPSQKKIEELMKLRARMWGARPKIRQRDIARKIRVTQSFISHVLNGRKNSERVINAIEEEIRGRRGNHHFQGQPGVRRPAGA